MKKAIIIPTFNEKENIEKLISRILFNIPDADIFIIDDTLENDIKTIIKKFKINYHHRGKKLGRGSAVLMGFAEALKIDKYDVFIEMDADLSHNPDEINNNLKKFRSENLDLLISSRYLAKSSIINWGFNRKLFSKASNILARFLLSIPVSDYTNGFRFYSFDAIKFVTANCGRIGGGFVILSEILMQLYYNNFKVGETSTIFRNRVRGESSVNTKEVINSLLGLWKLYKIKKIKKF